MLHLPDDAGDDDHTRVQLDRVLSGLRHLDGSDEPARVFAGLAQICVPALCDECLIEITEQAANPYRIRRIRPGLTPMPPSSERSPLNKAVDAPPEGKADQFGVAVDADGPWLRARFASLPGGGPPFHGALAGRWHDDYTPVPSDSALIGVLVDHAVALIHRERTARAGQLGDDVGRSLPVAHRIAAASGILMALYHLSPSQARQLLARAGEHNGRSVADIADTVLLTGALPPPGSSVSGPAASPAPGPKGESA